MRIISILLLLLFVTTASSQQNFKIDNTTKLSDLKGQVVYLDFWASWCKPCRASFPWMNDMQAKYGDKGLTIVAINLDENKANADLFLQKLPANFRMVFDPSGKIATQYELIGMPSSYIIDKTGQLRVSHQGFFKAKKDAYETQIKQLLAE